MSKEYTTFTKIEGLGVVQKKTTKEEADNHVNVRKEKACKNAGK